MSIVSRSLQYGTVFGHWQVHEQLGQGSGGKSAVFRLVHESSGTVESALKVIGIMEGQGSWTQLSPLAREEYQQTLAECKQMAEQEVLLMNGLRGRTNIVDYLDHTFIEWSDGNSFGCDMLIRIELLRDLQSELRRGRILSEQEIIAVGKGICSALILCHSKNIIHRDIKPGNIFFNDEGNYKLGDFGIAKILEASDAAMASTAIGTALYAAPEQISRSYDSRVDIYSLGLVLYELCNCNQLPFVDAQHGAETASHLRMTGNPLPPPRCSKSALTDVILIACAYRKEDRFQSAEAFFNALCSLDGCGTAALTDEHPSPEEMISPAGSSVQPQTVCQTSLAQSQRGYRQNSLSHQQESFPPLAAPPKKKLPIWIALLCVGVLAAASVFLLLPKHSHTWLKADCESSRTCSECGAVDGTALGHAWIAATCDAPKGCSRCGFVSDAALGHSWTAASCDAPKTCSRCGSTQGAPLGHQWAAATRTLPKTCTVCSISSGTAACTPLTYCEMVEDSNVTGSSSDVAIGDWVDRFSSHHPDSINFWVMDTPNTANMEYGVFRLGSKYETLIGDIVLEKNASSASEAFISIYGDGRLLYKSSTVDIYSSIERFTIDVSGVTLLRIECTTFSSASTHCILDATLSQP